MKKSLLLIVAIIALQLLPTAVFAAAEDASNNTKSVYGFVFQDNDGNGMFDEIDNTFPCALIKIQAVDSNEIYSVSVGNTGYFETEMLAEGRFYIWAEHYDLISSKRTIEIDHSNSPGMITIGLSKTGAVTRSFDDDTKIALPQMEMDMNVTVNDGDLGQPTFAHNVMLPLISS